MLSQRVVVFVVDIIICIHLRKRRKRQTGASWPPKFAQARRSLFGGNSS